MPSGRVSDRFKAVRSDQTFRIAQHQPVRRYMSAGSSPVALTPGFSSISPLYPLPASPSSASSSSTTLDDAVGRLFTRFLPTFFDLLEKYQYQKALLVVDGDEETQWKSWTAFKVMLKLCASCESTYHLMKYLETEMVKTDTIEHMYGKLTVLMNHLADELKPMVARQSRHFSVHTPTPSNGHAKGSQNGGGEENGVETDPDLMMEIAMCGDMGYYVELLEQGAEFFSLRVPMLQLYRGLALASLPRDYSEMLKRLENLLLRFDTFDHPLLETMKQSAIEELSTVHAAIQCEVRVTEYDFTRSIVAMHRLKVQLRSWSEHIDAVSDYPLFEGNTVDLGAAGQDEGLLLEESDDSYDPTSNSVYSITSVSNLSTSSHSRAHQAFPLTSTPSGNSHPGNGAVSSSSLVDSYLSYRGGRYANMGDTSYDIADEMAMLERHTSGVSLNSSSSPASETTSTFRRLFSHSSLLRRGGLTSALPIRRALVQKPGDPYISSSGANSSVPSNTLEQVILGGGVNSVGTPVGGSNGLDTSQGGVNSGGGIAGSTNPLAAEMMASSMEMQERNDGFALPVFQWSKRFYRSLVAKFTLYFHRWLEPFEKKTDYLSNDLSRFIKTPLGISYLQLMDVLLSRAAHRGDGGTIRIMLIFETQQLENKGAHYYENGYRCPSSSNALYTRTEQEEKTEREEQEAKQKIIASTGSADTSGVSSRTHSPASSRGGASPLHARRRSVENHALFMRVDREENEEQNDFSELWGLRSWPAVFCYPEGSTVPLAHWPNIISLIMENRSAVSSVHPVFMHGERRQKTTYHIAQVDEAMYLVLLVEGAKKTNEKVAQDFMQTVTENLQHSGAFGPRVLASPTAAST